MTQTRAQGDAGISVVRAAKVFFFSAFFSFFAAVTPLGAFGKNQLYTDTFDWQTCETENFQIYFYPTLADQIDGIAGELESARSGINDFLGVSPKGKAHFLFFENHPDFQSNRLYPVGWGTGGFSEPMKNRFVMPFYTSPREFRHILAHEYTHINSFDIFYGGFWRSLSLVRTMIYPIPLWMQEGLAEFCSDVWDPEDAAALRDIYLNGLLLASDDMISFSHLEGYRVYLAYKQSQKMMIFIAEKYGEQKVPELIRQFPHVWEQNIALKKVLDLNARDFDKEFASYLDSLYRDVLASRNSPEAIAEPISPEFSFYRSRAPLLTEHGEFFISDAYGYDEPMRMKDGKIRRFVKKNYFDRIAPALAYGNGELIFYAWKNAKPYIVRYGLEGPGKGRLRRMEGPFSDVRQIEFVAGGGLLFAADMNARSDIFLWEDGVITNLTDDEDFEDSFTFDAAGQRLIYSCERDEQLDLRELKMATGEKNWLTSTKHDERRPAVTEEGLFFISGRGGFDDIYLLGSMGTVPIDLSETVNLTAIKTGINDFSVSAAGDIAFVCQWQGARGIYMLDRSTGPFTDYLSTREKNFLKRGIDIKSPAAGRAAASDPYAVAGIDDVKESASPQAASAAPFNFRPYKTRWTLDLMYPLAMFVFAEGDADFYLLNYFQASDMLSRHETSLFLQWLSSTKDMNYDFSYLYKKWKTSVGFFASGYRDTRWVSLEDNSERLIRDNKRHSAGLLFRRPLDREHRLELRLGRTVRDWTLLRDYSASGNPYFYEDRENYYMISLIRDNSVYRFMDVVNGSRSSIGFKQSRGKFEGGEVRFSTSAVKGDINYDSLYAEHQMFLPLRFPGDILALRLFGRFSWGPTPEVFDLSRWDRVRGLRTFPEANRLALFSAEYRFYIFPNINYNLWWLLPPMFFQNLKGVLFYDAGECFSRSDDFKRGNIEHSVGFGFRLHTLLFQTYPLMLSWDRARMLNRDGYETYFKLGMNW